MYTRVYEYKDRDMGIEKVRIRKVWLFSGKEFLKNIDFLIAAPNFSIGGGQGYGIRRRNRR